MCFACDSTDHRAGDLKCPKLAPKSRAAIQKRAEFSEGNKGGKLMRELQELRKEKQAHFRMLGDKVSSADKGETRGFGHGDDWEDEDEEDVSFVGALGQSHASGARRQILFVGALSLTCLVLQLCYVCCIVMQCIALCCTRVAFIKCICTVALAQTYFPACTHAEGILSYTCLSAGIDREGIS